MGFTFTVASILIQVEAASKVDSTIHPQSLQKNPSKKSQPFLR